MKIAYADCFSGISGDMFLAALLDAGLPLEVLQDGIGKLNLPKKVELHLLETHKGALRAATLEVIVPHSHQHRKLSDILEILSASQLSGHVRQTTASIFNLLAKAEARVHGESVEQIHFHEVGALDSIVDVTGAVIGMEALGIERLYASPLPYGSGMVNSDHATLPLPAPATLEVLRLAQAPLTPSPAQVELVTPTGAAILAALATFERPNLTVTGLGVGAGKRDLPWPNIMRLIVGETPSAGNSEMIQIETNIDDMNPQVFGYVMEKLFAAGALDVYLIPIYMKKNRPATLLGVTLGLRVQPIYRYEANRDFRLVHTPYGDLNVKLKIINGQVIQAMPEYDDCVQLANENGVSLADIYAAAGTVTIHEI
jgi:uncharacterized protein (TIGR00299 family) protein